MPDPEKWDKLQAQWAKEAECVSNHWIVCPHCGYRDEDIYDYEDGEHKSDCGDCGKEFVLTVNTTTTYQTAPPGGWPEEEL